MGKHESTRNHKSSRILGISGVKKNIEMIFSWTKNVTKGQLISHENKFAVNSENDFGSRL